MVKIFSPDDIRPLLSIKTLMKPVTEAYRVFSAGKAHSPAYILYPSDGADIHVKSAVVDGSHFFSVKMAGWAEALAEKGETPSSGLIVVFDSKTCLPVAILDDDHLISDYRTAAAGAVANDHLAVTDAESVALVGAGRQARLQAEAAVLVRPVKRFHLWARNSERRKAFAADLRHAFPAIEVIEKDMLRDAVAAAQIIVMATSARKPLLEAGWLREGQHVISVGADDETKCEISRGALERADRIAVDDREAARRYGNLYRACEGGAFCGGDRITELGKIVTQRSLGRRRATDITITSLVGLGIQDLAVVNELMPSLG